MHKYLRAIGFSSITKRKDYESLIRVCANEADNRAYTSNGDDTMLAVFSKDFAPGMGISICGEYDENNHFSYDYSFPYLNGNGISSYADLTIERHADKISFAGVCDDINVGVIIYGCAGSPLLHGLFSSCGEQGLPYLRCNNRGPH